MFTGEIIALIVAVSWTVTALCFEFATKKIGALTLNAVRLIMAIIMLGITLELTTGSFAPWNAGMQAWIWLLLSGLVGYVFGDFCLFNSYALIGSRFGQLFMTLAPPVAGLAGYIMLGEKMSPNSLLGMAVCLTGIVISIFGKNDKNGPHSSLGLKLPVRGILYGIGAGIGQGVGLVLSKIGMNAYIAACPDMSDMEMSMLPFSATQVRAFSGIAGFMLIIMLRGETGKLLSSFKDSRSMLASAAGTFFGPFLGVSLSLMAVRYTTAGTASTLMALTPVIIILPSMYFFKEKVSARQILGAIVSVSGVALFFL